MRGHFGEKKIEYRKVKDFGSDMAWLQVT